MADLSEILRQLAFYQNGGGGSHAGVGQVLGAVGGLAQGVGTGLSEAAAPGLEVLKRKQDFAKAILEHAVEKGPISGQDLMTASQSGNLNPTTMYGEPAPKAPKLEDFINGVVGPDGTIHDLPPTQQNKYKKGSLLTERPAPQPKNEPTIQIKQKEKIDAVRGAIESGILPSDIPDSEPIPITTANQVRAYIIKQGLNPKLFEKEISQIKAPEPVVEKPEEPGFLSKTASGLGHLASQAYHKAEEKLSPSISDSQALSHLKSIRAKPTPANIKWAKEQLKGQ